jgi:hypothetical protein
VPTRRPLSASVYRPPTLGPPQPARPTSANPNADVQHWGHVRRSSAPASYTAEAERQGGRGSRGMHTSNEMYALYRQVQTQGRLPAFGLTSGYNGGSLTGESLEVAAEDSIEAGPRPPSGASQGGRTFHCAVLFYIVCSSGMPTYPLNSLIRESPPFLSRPPHISSIPDTLRACVSVSLLASHLGRACAGAPVLALLLTAALPRRGGGEAWGAVPASGQGGG